MPTKNAPAIIKPNLAQKIAARFSVEPERLLTTLKQTAFRQSKGADISDAQMMALMIVADQYGLNPFTKELYAYPDKQNGIVPVVSVDGWTRIINGNSAIDGIQFAYADDETIPDHGKLCPIWIDCIITRNDRTKPIVVREYLDECYRQPFKRDDGSVVNGPWQTHTKRMLRHKALIQCARIAFGFSGIYDDDEARRIIERDITPETEIIRIEGPRSKSELNQESAAPQEPLSSGPPSDSPAVAADPNLEPDNDAIVKDIESWVKRKKWDMALDLVRSLSTEELRTKTLDRINIARKYVQEKEHDSRPAHG